MTQISIKNNIVEYWVDPRSPDYTSRDALFPRRFVGGQRYEIDGKVVTKEEVDKLVNSEYVKEAVMDDQCVRDEIHAPPVLASLCEIIHDLLGPFDGRDPETDGPVDLVTTGECVRKTQAVLAEVE